jgi:hypothetical protein
MTWLTPLTPVNRPKIYFMTQPLEKTKTTRNKSVGSRVTNSELELVQRWAKQEGLTVGDFIMKTIRFYAEIKNNKEILFQCIENDMQPLLIITNSALFEKKKRLLGLLKKI